jgi:tRNA pseudouridine38-40 synthase
MVRAIVGSLVELGRGKISLNELRSMIEAQDRRRVPATAPAKGLVLEEILY